MKSNKTKKKFHFKLKAVFQKKTTKMQKELSNQLKRFLEMQSGYLDKGT